MVVWLSVCLVCVVLRFDVVDGGRKRRGCGRRRVLKYPSKPLSLRPGKVRVRAFGIHMIIDVIPSFQAHLSPRSIGASRTSEARSTSVGSPCSFSLARLEIHPSKSPESSTS